MKTIKLIIAILFFATSAMAQVAINTSGNNPDASAMLEVTSTSKGLLIPRMTAAQRGQIANPATGLLVYQTDGTTGFYYNAGTPSAANWIQLSSTLITELEDADNDTKVQVEESADEDKIRFDIGGSEKVIIDNNGNMGIGTTSPNSKLDVNGTLRLSSGVNDGEQIEWRTNASRHWNIDQYEDDLRFFTEDNSDANGATRITFTESGQVGIGFSNPTNKLEVNGSLKVGAYVLPSTDGTNGQILKTNGSGALSWANDNNTTHLWSESNGNVYRSSGKVGIGTSTPSAKLQVVNGALLFSGTTGSTPTSGASTRMMWIPAKAAFRAGVVTGTQWDNSNIGDYSFASGYNTKASDYYSTAMGNNTIASGISSTAMGKYSIASGNYSTAIGKSTTASSDFATAMGLITTASGYSSTAIGRETTASGYSSTAMGRETTASGHECTTMGYLTTAKSYCETAIGYNNTDYTPASTNSWNTSDRLFVIGNGTSSSAKSNAMVVLKNGNTGIGFSNPTHKLEVNGSLKVGAYVLPSTDGTFGQLLKTNGSGALSWTNDNNTTPLWTESSGNIYRSSGNVGIGTTSPGNALHISGGSLKIESSDNDKIIFGGTNTDPHTFYDASSKGFRFWDATNGALLIITNSGNIGIGTVNPSCPLEINASANLTASYGYLNSSGLTGTYSGTSTYSIKVSNRIMASEFNAVSDKRVKTNFEISNSLNDLQILNQLEVTNYSYIDTVAKGDEVRLGFIAQQVETVFPQAINKSTNYIPNIYKPSNNVVFDSVSNTQTITLLDNHNLQKGDMIKLISNDKIYEREVIEVLSATEFKVKTTLKTNNQLFVFGKQVNDFRAVDYDRIFVLGISAIQELYKELEALKAENNNLKAENTSIKTTVQENSERLKNLERLIELQSSVMK